MAFNNAAYAPYLEALASIESGGNYGALGPPTKSGDRAYGKYQVMGKNVPEWTKIALGQQMSPDDFMKNPDAQDRTAEHYFGSAMNKYGNPQDAASVWFSGKPQAQGLGLSDGYHTGSQYIENYNKALQAQGVDPQTAIQAALDQGSDGAVLPPNAQPTMQQGTQEDKGFFGGLGDRFSKDPAGMIGNALSGLGAGLMSAANPYAGAALQNQFMARMQPKWGVIGKDHWGQDEYGWINPYNQTVTKADGSATGTGGGVNTNNNMLVKLQEAGANGASTEDKLKLVDADMRPYVQAIIEGRQLPQNIGRMMRDRINATAFAVDDKLDQNSLLQRQAFAKNMGLGSPNSYGGQVASANKLVNHLDMAKGQIAELTDPSFFSLKDSDTLSALNGIKQNIRSQSGDQGYKDAMSRWETTKGAIGDEIEKMLAGSQGAYAAKKQWMDRLDISKGPTSAASALDEIRGVMMGQIQGIAHAKEMAYGKPVDPMEFFGQPAQESMKRVQSGTYQPSDAPKGEQAAAAPPVQGAKLAPDGHYYVPDPNRPGKYLKVN